MLFVSSKEASLKKIVFTKHLSIRSDELNVLSGYIGSSSIEELGNIGINVKVIYGLARQAKLNEVFHSDLCKLHAGSTRIYCPRIPSHAKIYIWKYKGEIVYILNGSANFSASGLETPLKEVLSEVHHTSFAEFNRYFELIFNSSMPVNKVNLEEFGLVKAESSTPTQAASSKTNFDPNVCVSGSLYSPASKINWGHGNANTHKSDAYIPIRIQDILNFPNLFPEKTNNKGLGYNDNAPIEILWDDGVRMPGLLEGSAKIQGLRFPNKISSFKSKKIMGDYLRSRLGLGSGEIVTPQVFENYGRDNVSISLLGEGIYFIDFSV